MKKLLFAYLLLPALAFAHIDTGHDPVPQAAPISCYSVAARAAWGAYGQTLGAPAVFKYVTYAELHMMFMTDKVPNDGIYVLADMNEDERAAYEETARSGWLYAKDHPNKYSLEEWTAVFIGTVCETLTK